MLGSLGVVLAEQLSSKANKKVMIIDKQSHIGRNVYDGYDENGILVYKYGPHIFHTNSPELTLSPSLERLWI